MATTSYNTDSQFRQRADALHPPKAYLGLCRKVISSNVEGFNTRTLFRSAVLSFGLPTGQKEARLCIPFSPAVYHPSGILPIKPNQPLPSPFYYLHMPEMDLELSVDTEWRELGTDLIGGRDRVHHREGRDDKKVWLISRDEQSYLIHTMEDIAQELYKEQLKLSRNIIPSLSSTVATISHSESNGSPDESQGIAIDRSPSSLSSHDPHSAQCESASSPQPAPTNGSPDVTDPNATYLYYLSGQPGDSSVYTPICDPRQPWVKRYERAVLELASIHLSGEPKQKCSIPIKIEYNLGQVGNSKSSNLPFANCAWGGYEEFLEELRGLQEYISEVRRLNWIEGLQGYTQLYNGVYDVKYVWRNSLYYGWQDSPNAILGGRADGKRIIRNRQSENSYLGDRDEDARPQNVLSSEPQTRSLGINAGANTGKDDCPKGCKQCKNPSQSPASTASPMEVSGMFPLFSFRQAYTTIQNTQSKELALSGHPAIAIRSVLNTIRHIPLGLSTKLINPRSFPNDKTNTTVIQHCSRHLRKLFFC